LNLKEIIKLIQDLQISHTSREGMANGLFGGLEMLIYAKKQMFLHLILIENPKTYTYK